MDVKNIIIIILFVYAGIYVGVSYLEKKQIIQIDKKTPKKQIAEKRKVELKIKRPKKIQKKPRLSKKSKIQTEDQFSYKEEKDLYLEMSPEEKKDLEKITQKEKGDLILEEEKEDIIVIDKETRLESADEIPVKKTPDFLKTDKKDHQKSINEMKQKPGNPALTYPIEEYKKKQEGVVELSYYVTKDGRVEDIQLIKSSNYPNLDESAIKTVKKFRFEENQEGRVIHKLEFKIQPKAK